MKKSLVLFATLCLLLVGCSSKSETKVETTPSFTLKSQQEVNFTYIKPTGEATIKVENADKSEFRISNSADASVAIFRIFDENVPTLEKHALSVTSYKFEKTEIGTKTVYRGIELEKSGSFIKMMYLFDMDNARVGVVMAIPQEVNVLRVYVEEIISSLKIKK